MHLKTKYYNGPAVMKTGHYPFDKRQPYLLFEKPSGEPIITASVMMEGQRLQPGEIFISTWAACEGLMEFLIEAGLLMDTGRRVPAGYVEAAVCRKLYSEV